MKKQFAEMNQIEKHIHNAKELMTMNKNAIEILLSNNSYRMPQIILEMENEKQAAWIGELENMLEEGKTEI